MNVPKSTMASMILKRKNCGTTRILPRASHTAKLSNQERGTLVRELTKNLTCEKLPERKPSPQHSTDLAIMAERPDARLSSVNNKTPKALSICEKLHFPL